MTNKILFIAKSNKRLRFNHLERSSASFRVLENKKINKIIKNLKRTDLDIGLKKTIQWYKKFVI